jgi:hypothetical protein
VSIGELKCCWLTSFSIAFNGASSITDATTGLTVNSISGLPAGGTYEYSWNPTLHVLEIGAAYLTSEAEVKTQFAFNLTNPAAPLTDFPGAGLLPSLTVFPQRRSPRSMGSGRLLV